MNVMLTILEGKELKAARRLCKSSRAYFDYAKSRCPKCKRFMEKSVHVSLNPKRNEAVNKVKFEYCLVCDVFVKRTHKILTEKGWVDSDCVIVKNIYTMAQLAREFKVTRERVRVWWNEGRLPHDIEDQSGRPYWSSVPKYPTKSPPGRKVAKGGR